LDIFSHSKQQYEEKQLADYFLTNIENILLNGTQLILDQVFNDNHLNEYPKIPINLMDLRKTGKRNRFGIIMAKLYSRQPTEIRIRTNLCNCN
jgi:hypothetical protein